MTTPDCTQNTGACVCSGLGACVLQDNYYCTGPGDCLSGKCVQVSGTSTTMTCQN